MKTSNIKYQKQYLKTVFGNNGGLFLHKLLYWSENKKNYGVIHEERVWIYNTLEDWSKQLDCSVKTIQRATKMLRDAGIIDQKFLSRNKRNRTLFYSVNYEKLWSICNDGLTPPSQKDNNALSDLGINDQNEGHMNNNNKQNKSNKSISVEFSQDCSHECSNVSTKPSNDAKPTIVQDMIKIWHENFKNSKLILTKQLAKYLVAAFKTKFKSNIIEWKKYIEMIKSSKYLCGDKFYLTINWAIKFFTIDRIKNGDLGVNKNTITLLDSVLEEQREENLKKALEHVDSVQESDDCKAKRRDIIKRLSPEKYNSWFTRVSLWKNAFKEVFMFETDSPFVRDYINAHFSEVVGVIS